jgi:hypothetical protein
MEYIFIINIFENLNVDIFFSYKSSQTLRFFDLSRNEIYIIFGTEGVG